MSVFRFNPVFQQWVLLGPAIPNRLQVSSAQLLSIGQGADLVAASHPRSPFVLDADPAPYAKASSERLYTDNPPVGDYELFLYGGKQEFFTWKAKQWEVWLSLVQHRILQQHHNPYVHYLSLSLRTSALDSVEGYERVGDFIATSHPIMGEAPSLTIEIAEKLMQKEAAYLLHQSEEGSLRVPSAPLHEQELWFIPTHYQAGIEQMSSAEREECAYVLSRVFPVLHDEWPKEHWVLEIHTHIVGHSDETTWWISIHRESSSNALLPVQPFPENFYRSLKLRLAKMNK